MKNELIAIGPITIHGYGLMIAIGIIAAYIVAEYRAKKKNLNHELIIDLTIWSILGGFFGAKILFFITQIKEIEFFRGDILRGSIGNLSTSQFISIFMFIVGVGLFFVTRYYIKNRNKKDV